MSDTDTIALGDYVQDTLTGFEGKVFAIYTFLHGCRRINVQGRKVDAHDNVSPVDFTFDEPQLLLLRKDEEAAARIAMTKSLTGPVPG